MTNACTDAPPAPGERAFVGGCACKAVRYRCRGEPLAMYHCHCRACQYASGGAFSPLLIVYQDDMAIEGLVEYRHLPAGDDHHVAGSCAKCGAQLFARADRKPTLLLVRAATLDDAAWFKPVADIWTVSAQPWTTMDRHIPKVFKSPPVLETDGAVTT